MDAAPKISVLLPCYRQERFVREAVESVLMQDFPDWEMVASDDASPDGTAAILEHYAGRDARIRFSRQEKNLGMVENWNWCLQQARGTAIKLMGADDRLETPDCLSRQWESLQRPGIALVASARRLIDEQSRPFQTEAGFPPGSISGRAAMTRMLETQTNLVGEPVCALFRKEAAAKGFHPGYPQLADMEMWFQLLRQGDLFYEKESLCSFRIHTNQLSQINLRSGDSLKEHIHFMLAQALENPLRLGAKRNVYFWILEMIRGVPSAKNRGFETSLLDLRKRCGGAGFWIFWLRHQLARARKRLSRSIAKRVRPHPQNPPAQAR